MDDRKPDRKRRQTEQGNLTIIFVRAIWITAITLGVVIGLAFFVPELLTAQGVAHPLIRAMQQGGEPHSYTVIALGWAFGVLNLVLIFLMFSLGVSRGNSLRGMGRWFATIFALIVAVWTGIVLAYVGFITNPQQPTLFGFPLPTGLMIFVMPPVSFLVNILFVARFPRSILTDEDLDKYRQLAAAGDESTAHKVPRDPERSS